MNLILLIICINIFNLNTKKIDQNLKKEVELKLSRSKDYFSNLDLFNSLKEAEDAINFSKKHNYDLGIIKGNIYISKVFIEIGDFKKSIFYLSEADKYLNKNDVLEMRAEVHRLRGICYSNLGLDDFAIKEFNKQLTISEKITDINNKNLSIFWAYQNISHIYSNNGNDSVWIYLNKQKNQLSKFNFKKEFLNYSTTYTQIGTQFILEGNVDSASYYIDKSLNILYDNKYPYLYYTYQKKGDLYDLKNDKISAIKYYTKALDNAKEINHINAIKNSYKILSDYLVSNNIQKELAADYYYQYQKLNDSLNLEDEKLSKNIYKYVIDKENKDFWTKELWKYFIIEVFLIIIIVLFYRYKNKKVKVESLEMLEKVEQKYLNNLNNEKFQQLLELSKKNDPEFLILFKELYPCFVEKLKELDNTIRSSELAFCAMLYLNYSTKDIAEYTFVTVRAVQVRKNRLRKKYNIPSNMDLNRWMRNLCEQK